MKKCKLNLFILIIILLPVNNIINAAAANLKLDNSIKIEQLTNAIKILSNEKHKEKEHASCNFSNKELLKAIQVKDIKKSKLLLEEELESNSIYSLFEILLPFAIDNKNNVIVELLINIKNEHNKKLLYKAISNNNISATELLLLDGIDINVKDAIHRTPLYYAIYVKSLDIVELLLKYGADVNNKDKLNETPVHMAINNNDIDILKLLLKYGARVNIKNGEKNTPLHISIAKDIDIIKLLLKKGVDINAKDIVGRTPLHLAIGKGKKNIVKLLLKEGANINVQDNRGKTPLFYAIINNNMDMLRLLLKSGANVNIQDNNKDTPLDIAKEEELEEIVDILERHCILDEYFILEELDGLDYVIV